MGNSFDFKWDKKGMRDLEQQVKKSVQHDIQKFFDRFSQQYSGQSIENVKVALAREWRQRIGGSITDPELTEYATAISNGDTIKVR